ncbi:MAG TPA: hypothetical protein VGI75_14315, partial [Pirellulales bacterium]
MRRWRDYFSVLGLCSLSLAHVAHAADGDPDPSFGSQGGTTFALSSSNNDYATAVSEVAGGKLLVVGECGSVACITRLLPNGSLDSTYGFLGVGYSHFDQFATAPPHSFATGLTVLPDGRAVVVGCTDLPIGALFMVRADGSGLDTSVGGGKGYFAGVSGSITPSFCPSSVIRQGDGKFLTTQTGQIDGFGEVILVARIAADLSGLDSSFGTNGVAELAFGLGAPGDNTDLQGGIALQNDGKVVVGGTAINQNNVPVMV